MTDITCPKCGSTDVSRHETTADDYVDCECDACGTTFVAFVGSDDDLEDAEYDD